MNDSQPYAHDRALLRRRFDAFVPDALRAQRDQLRLAIRQSVFLGLTGLGAAALGSVFDKVFFGT
jgi:hypothetical protein